MSDLKAKLFLQNTIKKSQETGEEVFIDTSKGFLSEECVLTFKAPQVLEFAIHKIIRGRSLVKITQHEKELLLKMDVDNHMFEETILSIIEKEYLVGKSVKVKNEKNANVLSWGMDGRFASADARR